MTQHHHQAPAPPAAPNVSIDIPPEFHYGRTGLEAKEEVAKDGPDGTLPEVQVTSLDALSKFTGTFKGFGFNTIFRPDSRKTPTILHNKPTDPIDDNILQLNLTSETMAFSAQLGDVPNRGLLDQADISLNGVPYTQTISDAMELLPGQKPPVLHFEPGLWMRVPASVTMPDLSASYVRMASIPHGTTINAQCFNPAVTSPGAPSFPQVGITPIIIQGDSPNRFASQSVDDKDSRRLPQDLSKYSNAGTGPFAGTITQDILNNPNNVLSNANKGKNILEHTTFEVSTVPTAPALGGGTSNIGFNIGADDGKINPATPAKRSGNANAVTTTAQYWISTVRAKIDLQPYSYTTAPSCPPKEPKLVSPASLGPRDAVPQFTVDFTIPSPKTVTVEYTQIQYSQMVVLDFNGLSWPHATVATLAPSGQSLSEVIV